MNTRPRSRSSVQWSRQFAAGILLTLTLIAHGSVGTAAQGTSSVTLGDSTLTYSSDWELLGEDSVSATLQHEGSAYALFDYSVYAQATSGAGDPSGIIASTRIEPLASQDIIDNIRLAERGELPDGTVWELYTMEVNGIAIFYLAAANVVLAPGFDVVTSLATPLEDIIGGQAAVMSGITVDGEPTLIANIPPDELLAAAWTALDDSQAPRPPAPPAGPVG